MGCTSSKKPKPSGQAPPPIPKPPEKPPEKLPIDVSEVYEFLVTISRLKARGLAKGTGYALRLIWGDKTFTTTLVQGENIKWPNEWTFNTQAPVSFLQETHLVVTLIDSSDHELSHLAISLWNITVGPSYQSFSLHDFRGKQLGRLGMDLKVVQRTVIEVIPQDIKCTMNHPEVGKWSVSIRCATSTDMETGHSEVKDEPKWALPQDDLTPETSLRLSFPTTLEALENASLQFRLWKHKKSDEKVLHGECWVGFNKLLKDERISAVRRSLSKTITISKDKEPSNLGETTFTQKDARIERKLTERLWSSGREVGQISISMLVMNFPLIAQLVAGVNTEDGVQIQSASSVDGAKRSRKALPQNLVEIASQVETLQQYLRAKSGVVKVHSDVVKNHTKDIMDLIQKLKETDKEATISHVYSSEAERMDAQQLLLEVGEYLMNWADYVAYEVRGYYCEALMHLMRRGELELGQISLERAADPSQQEKRIEIAVRYRTLMHRVLAHALSKMNLKGADPKVQEFSEAVFAICYFRIPEFQEKLLSGIKKKSYELVPEWRGTTFDLEEDITESANFPLMFNWQEFFYDYLPADNDPKYLQALNEERWQNRMEKRGIAYFRFIKEWASDIRRLFIHKKVPYHEFPGYNVLLKTFLLELKSRDLMTFPDALVEASKALLHNPELISVFMHILFLKTDANRWEAVKETYRIMNEWLTFLYENGHTLPTSFNNSILITGLRVTLSHELNLNNANALWLVYRNYQILHPDTKWEVVYEGVLGSEVHRLMCHWSEVVRGLFLNLLLFRLMSLESLPLEERTRVDDMILERAKEVVRELEYEAPSERVALDMVPYLHLAKEEYRKKRMDYELWLGERQEQARKPSSKRIWGPFPCFPYPEVTVRCLFQDEVENQAMEDW